MAPFFNPTAPWKRTLCASAYATTLPIMILAGSGGGLAPPRPPPKKPEKPRDLTYAELHARLRAEVDKLDAANRRLEAAGQKLEENRRE